MLLSVKFDKDQYSKWCENVNKEDTVDNKEKGKGDIVAVPDTGASVDCSGVDILAIFGLRRRHLIPTKAILRTANRKALTVLGIIPVEIETMSADKETRVKVKAMWYVVEELRCTIISKVTLEDLDIISKYFPQPSPRRGYA